MDDCFELGTTAALSGPGLAIEGAKDGSLGSACVKLASAAVSDGSDGATGGSSVAAFGSADCNGIGPAGSDGFVPAGVDDLATAGLDVFVVATFDGWGAADFDDAAAVAGDTFDPGAFDAAMAAFLIGPGLVGPEDFDTVRDVVEEFFLLARALGEMSSSTSMSSESDSASMAPSAPENDS